MLRITLKVECDQCDKCGERKPDLPSSLSYEGDDLKLAIEALKSFLSEGSARVLCPRCAANQ